MANVLNVNVYQINSQTPVPLSSVVPVGFGIAGCIIEGAESLLSTGIRVYSKITVPGLSKSYFATETEAQLVSLGNSGSGGSGVSSVTGDLVTGTATDPVVDIEALSAAAGLDGTEVVAVVQGGGQAVKTTTQDIADLGGGGGPTIYTGDGSLTGNRIVDLDGKSIYFQDGSFQYLILDPSANGNASLNAQNITDGGNTAHIGINTTDANASFQLGSYFNAFAKYVQIDGVANVSAATLAYTADTHTFNGKDFLVQTTDGTAAGTIESISDTGGGNIYFNINADNGTTGNVGIFGNAIDNKINITLSENGTQIVLDDAAQTITLTAANGVGINMTPTSVSPFAVASLPAFTNNADAVSGGLTAGMFYRISVAGTSTVAVVE